MKRTLALVALLSGCATAPQAAAAPDFNLATDAGKPVHGADLWQSRPVLLVFMTSWCASCRAEVPQVNEYARTHAVVAIATGDTPEKVGRWRAETGATYPVLLDDGRVARAYGIVSSPTCVLVDPGGAISWRGPHVPGWHP